MGIGGFQSSTDPMHNAAFTTQFESYELNRDNAPVSDTKRKAAYVAMGILSTVIIGIVGLFIFYHI